MIYLFLLLVSMAGWLVHITVLLHIVVCPLLLHIPWLVGSTLMGFMPILLYALLLVGSIFMPHSTYSMPYALLLVGFILPPLPYSHVMLLMVYAHTGGLCPYCWCMPL